MPDASRCSKRETTSIILDGPVQENVREGKDRDYRLEELERDSQAQDKEIRRNARRITKEESFKGNRRIRTTNGLSGPNHRRCT